MVTIVKPCFKSNKVYSRVFEEVAFWHACPDWDLVISYPTLRGIFFLFSISNLPTSTRERSSYHYAFEGIPKVTKTSMGCSSISQPFQL